MSAHWNMLGIAVEIANLAKKNRNYYVGAVARRKDGAIVGSPNGWPVLQNAWHHAEARLVRKLETTDTVYVARLKKTGEKALARPCEGCQIMLRSKKIEKVIYTISDKEYGVLYL